MLHVQILSGFKNRHIQDLTLRRCDTLKSCQWNFFNFAELFNIGKYVKIWFKNRRPPYEKDQKYYKNWTKEAAFVYILGFIFYGSSRAKTDLHNKFIINFKFFEQDHLWNFFILGVYAKRQPKCARISKQKLSTIP